jgi:hypothetical protein
MLTSNDVPTFGGCCLEAMMSWLREVGCAVLAFSPGVTLLRWQWKRRVRGGIRRDSRILLSNIDDQFAIDGQNWTTMVS